MIELLYCNINRKECIMATREQEWEELLGIKTSGRDDSHSDGEHHPYEPTDYCVLERLANSGLIRKKNALIDYGSGKGRVSIFLAYQTGCHSLGIEYDERLWQKAMLLFLQSFRPAHAEAGPRENLRLSRTQTAAAAPLFLLSL